MHASSIHDRVQINIFIATGVASLQAQLCMQKVAALPAHFAHSFSFTPSSGLYYWSNVVNSE